MKNAGKARSYGLYRHLRTSKEIIENLLNYYEKYTIGNGRIFLLFITFPYAIHYIFFAPWSGLW